jgi:hypothetical protein
VARDRDHRDGRDQVGSAETKPIATLPRSETACRICGSQKPMP